MLAKHGDRVPEDFELTAEDWDQLDQLLLKQQEQWRELSSERRKLTKPIIERKLRDGDYLYEPLPASKPWKKGGRLASLMPRTSWEVVTMFVATDAATSRQMIKIVYVHPGESEAVDAVSEQLVEAERRFGHRIRDFLAQR